MYKGNTLFFIVEGLIYKMTFKFRVQKIFHRSQIPGRHISCGCQERTIFVC